MDLKRQPQHVIPLNDLKEHVTDGTPCPCNHKVEGRVVVHHSWDGREARQEAEMRAESIGPN